ncbi:conserved Plasmodium protein, unknown function [Plasmodium knowlesi strain H]|uniref:Uncharacterized protein n=3 Tax=Plasmodium knowlesi TaxID=5850 RepID=A0A5K1UUM1_PLAKH|nr:conserved protein, unknown function [Plasmodium knowlesi strain H]OTN63748.1 Uncharacterized protein PKNOH_S140278100 [Plasmodium knowlesi]CAA9991192.1 conserved protein, unknown function [Plasmodium knowlesi strain H]SBO26244.1 conserved Plasmodium protein, unknown function [Plasmodium knowlesi strain H]SBO29399.1 conserved Plasmodium protein, unknown function [Plasmodium knowlesi strain H]VVS80666.1 conserved protein, unknown function [Plasmodium knowlesi strain H]|eukprot:XP_002262475.1 hypothetical protein, conserved in Plasmodium species [Plasmodium knowlesi strain H]
MAPLAKVAPLFLLLILTICVQSMDPTKKGNENFPQRNQTTEETNFDLAFPSFNVHYNVEPKDWRHIESVEKEKNDFLLDAKNEINLMQEDKNKINYVLNVQKQQLEELQFLLNRMKHIKRKNLMGGEGEDKLKISLLAMPRYLRTGTFLSVDTPAEENILRAFNELHNYNLGKSRLTGRGSFYHTLAEQWVG